MKMKFYESGPKAEFTFKYSRTDCKRNQTNIRRSFTQHQVLVKQQRSDSANHTRYGRTRFYDVVGGLQDRFTRTEPRINSAPTLHTGPSLYGSALYNRKPAMLSNLRVNSIQENTTPSNEHKFNLERYNNRFEVTETADGYRFEQIVDELASVDLSLELSDVESTGAPACQDNLKRLDRKSVGSHRKRLDVSAIRHKPTLPVIKLTNDQLDNDHELLSVIQVNSTQSRADNSPVIIKQNGGEEKITTDPIEKKVSIPKISIGVTGKNQKGLKVSSSQKSAGTNPTSKNQPKTTKQNVEKFNLKEPTRVRVGSASSVCSRRSSRQLVKHWVDQLTISSQENSPYIKRTSQTRYKPNKPPSTRQMEKEDDMIETLESRPVLTSLPSYICPSSVERSTNYRTQQWIKHTSFTHSMKTIPLL